MPAGRDITDTTAYPVFSSKADFMDAYENLIRTENDRDGHMELLYRLSNTDTDNWTSGSTDRHDA